MKNISMDTLIYARDIFLTPEDLIHHAREIAKNHDATQNKKSVPYLLKKLKENYNMIITVYKQLNNELEQGHELSYASQWLMDNFYKIEEQYQEVILNLNKSKFLKLDILSYGYLKGYPRAYAIAYEYISHRDGRLDESLLVQFIQSYQMERVLKTDEIWSLSLMLRCALIDDIKGICQLISNDTSQSKRAEETLHDQQHIMEHVRKNMIDSTGVNDSYIEHLLRLMRRQGLETGDIVRVIQNKLQDYNTTVYRIIEDQHREQAKMKISIGNGLTSLNRISTLDWNDIFEKMSLVEEILEKDPSGIYVSMDFESRDYYRNILVEISKKFSETETRVARKAMECALKHNDDPKKNHVGYYLIDKGRNELLDVLGYPQKKDVFHNRKIKDYLLPVILLTAIFEWVIFMMLVEHQLPFLILLIMFALIVPFSEVSISFINYSYANLYKPPFLPRLELKEGINPELTTLVVIPALLPNEKVLRELMNRLEVYYLANKEKYIYFSIAGDFIDLEQKSTAADDGIIEAAKQEIKRLNDKYDGNIFYFFHRERIYNKNAQRWMGWERKRGALLELNRLLSGEDTSYKYQMGDLDQLKHVHYVITIDADTQLTIDTAKKLIGICAHPLHKPIIDGKTGRVVEGYGLIQPRIGIDLDSANKNSFTKIFGGLGGIDTYSTANSNVNQDLFGIGIFTGKGIYHLDVFHKLLDKRFPNNQILSHDLLEGSYLRTGLATDFELLDSFPSKYSAYTNRNHRWTRGDWQLIPWLKKYAPTKDSKERNPLSLISRWHIFDNLRRSLYPFCIFSVIILSFTLKYPAKILGVIGIILVCPLVIRMMEYVKNRYYQTVKHKFNCDIITGFRLEIYKICLSFIFLPYETYLLMDAVVRSIYRVKISQKNLLEWVTAAEAEKALSNNLKGYMKRMRISYWISLGFLIFTTLVRPQFILLGILFSMSWVMGPYMAYRISQEASNRVPVLGDEEQRYLMKVARKTWAYFGVCVNDENHYLPPDNYQEFNTKGIAHRTSPTNIGLYLLSVTTARDFGFITVEETVNRIEKTLKTIEGISKWKGHLYNWYDTCTLEVLRPLYVSTVDSGNFISYLIPVKEGLLELLEKPIFHKKQWSALWETLELVGDQSERTIEKYKDGSTIDMIEFIDYISNYNIDEDREIELWEEQYLQMISNLKKEISNCIVGDIMEEHLYQLSLKEMVVFYQRIFDESRIQSDIVKEITECIHYLENIIERVHHLVRKLEELVRTTNFSTLYDEKRNIFSIGYNVEEEKLTNSYYDLLASEARITSYLAIVKGEVKKKHWLKLGRGITVIQGFRGLVSWTGTMFEYFMPFLLMKNYNHSLMYETYFTTIKGQMQYSRKRGTPWGISESGYYAFDMAFNYQYKAFGVPDLGLKRGLSNEVVVSPYSTFLALPLCPKEATDNLKELKEQGLEGKYGFYEAIDYTPSKAYGKGPHIIYSYMTHHQGMIFNSINNCLNDFILQKRFHKDPLIKAGEVLLQEKIPLRVILAKEIKEDIPMVEKTDRFIQKMVRTYTDVEEYVPQCHVLSNGTYCTMINTHGGGYSRAGGIQITRWREDPLNKKNGHLVFIRHLNANAIWSTSYDLLCREPDAYKVVFTPEKAEIYRSDEQFDTYMEVIVSPEDNVEMRKVKITNHSDTIANMEVTSYFEVVLTNPHADLAHPAFSNLFVRTEVITEMESLIASRRPRGNEEDEKWLFHTVRVDQGESQGFQFETNRETFIGRGKELSQADALKQPLKDTAGIVLDPIMSLRKTLNIMPGTTVEITYITGVQDSRDDLLKLISKYRDYHNIVRTIELATTRSQIEQNYLNIDLEDMMIYQDMISSIIYLSSSRKSIFEGMEANHNPQKNLWGYGLSGDIPIVMITIVNIEDVYIVRKMLKAHEYWRMKGIAADLVILNMEENNYYQPLHQLLYDIVSGSPQRFLMDQPGGIHIKNSYKIFANDIPLLYSLSRIVIHAEKGIPKGTILGNGGDHDHIDYLPLHNEKDIIDTQGDPLDVQYFNGYGGFSKNGLEYIIQLKGELNTPAPWVNVIANKRFGFTVSEKGSGFTWCDNSRENKITPWSNDAISDPPGEIIYMRDEEEGRFWSLTPSPIRAASSYTIRHGMGYTVFSHLCQGLSQELTMFVPEVDPLKVNIIKIKNQSQGKRKLCLIYYVRPVLGVIEYVTQQHVITKFYDEINTLTMVNPFNNEYNHKIAFVSSSETIRSYTGNRHEFLGMHGDISKPHAMQKEQLSNSVGAGYDPCAAIQVSIELDIDEEKEIVMLLGQGESIKEIKEWTARYHQSYGVHSELIRIKHHWEEITGEIEVDTPDTSMNLLLNGWLLYQVLSCRLWARSAFYQSGGAYGFRDQLQDAMNMVNSLPQITREQIILHSAHQFGEGDVQHWWHPGFEDKGIRTRFSDDLLWLPYAVAKYVKTTGDESILYEVVPFLKEEELKDGEDERYGIPQISEEKGTVYQHCIRAIDRSLVVGDRGIPLMGSGDWNDGMNTVGNKGKGQSVWLGWFLYRILLDFSPLCVLMKDEEKNIKYRNFSAQLKKSLNHNAWDGQWYLRGFYDDGSPLGSSKNMECKIDSLGQSWAVISKGGEKEKMSIAMASMEEYLIKSNEALVLLFTPPFDNSEQEPGYIKGYVPGVRENGGQYTHAAAWVVKALAMLGEGNKAMEVYHMINPINHTRTQLECSTYKVEPYVMAADVYAVNPHVGRGGWSWYTGVAGWMYSVGLEDILGFNKKGNRLWIQPSIPSQWDTYTIHYRYKNSMYHIRVKREKEEISEKPSITVDGITQEEYILLQEDGQEHAVEVVVAESRKPKGES
ncbi:MAG: GH36-type glycosyl hydrolase domain-containing protein [Eubacteriales bacterium]